MIKPSEVCVHTAKVMEDLLPLYIDKVRKRRDVSMKSLQRFGVLALLHRHSSALTGYLCNNYWDD